MDQSTPVVDGTVLCQNKDCGEELVKDEKGDWPVECDFCETPTGLGVAKQCPDCGTERIRSKTGKYAVKCRNCKYKFTDGK